MPFRDIHLCIPSINVPIFNVWTMWTHGLKLTEVFPRQESHSSRIKYRKNIKKLNKRFYRVERNGLVFNFFIVRDL